MSEITSTRNPRVRDVAALQRAKPRRETGRHLVEGPHAVEHALAAGVVEEVFVTDPDLARSVPAEVSVTHVPEHVMERLSDARTPQGIVAVARTVTSRLDDVVGTGLLVVLFEVADPGNAGTILRTADAAGAHAIVATRGSVDLFAPKCVRSAAGSTYHLPVVVGADIGQVAVACRAVGQRLLALDGSGPTSVFDLETGSAPVALLLGNEARGLSSELVASVDDVVAVPIRGRAESLNVGAAAAVAIYAASRGLHRSG